MIQFMQDQRAMERPTFRGADVVNLVRQVKMVGILHGRRLGQAGIVDVVEGTPGVIEPVLEDLQRVMRVVEIVIENQPVLVAQAREFAEPLVIPGIETREVELAQPVGRGTRTRARPWHLIKRGPHICIGAGHQRVSSRRRSYHKPGIDM